MARAPEQVSDYRRHYRERHVPRWYRGRVHLASTFTISVIAIAYCVSQLSTVTAWEWLTIPITFLYGNLVEYFGHRGPMHHRIRGFGLIFRRHAGQHHRFFTDTAMQYDDSADYKAVLFPVFLIVFYLGGFALPSGLLLWLIFSANVALLFVATAVAYFLNYELLHFAYHAPLDSRIARLPFMARLRRLHTAHHNPALMQKCNFNITYPIGDLLFGTLNKGQPDAQ